MKLFKIEDYELNCFKFYFQDNISCMVTVEDDMLHVIAVYLYGDRMNEDNDGVNMTRVLDYFYRYNKDTWREKTFIMTPTFKKIMKSHL